MVQHRIRKRISIPPDYLAEDLETCVKNILNKERKQLNSRENGYVVKIEKIKTITNIVSRETNDIFLDVDFIVESFFLKPGIKLISTVKMILPTGILASCHDIKVWIPSNKMNGFTFKGSIYSKDNETILMNQDIQIQVSVIRYEKKSFSCIGKLTT